MESRIESYIEGVFRDVPHTERADSIRAEILQNLLDKYHDLIDAGREQEEAYAVAISSGGDLSGIVADLKGEPVNYSYTYEKQFERMYEKQYQQEKRQCRRFESWFWPAVVCVYLAYSFLRGQWAFSWMIFVAAPAVTNFYRFCVVQSNRKVRRGALSGFIWLTTVFVYLALSFLTMRWDVTWILFLIAVPVTRIADISVFRDDSEEDSYDA